MIGNLPTNGLPASVISCFHGIRCQMFRPLAILSVIVLLVAGVTAQSGRSALRGYVGFSDFSYNEVAEHGVRAKIELRRTADDKHPATTNTDEHGSFDFKTVAPGEYLLRISSPGYRIYETEVYLPSDFSGNLGVMLKKGKS